MNPSSEQVQRALSDTPFCTSLLTAALAAHAGRNLSRCQASGGVLDQRNRVEIHSNQNNSNFVIRIKISGEQPHPATCRMRVQAAGWQGRAPTRMSPPALCSGTGLPAPGSPPISQVLGHVHVQLLSCSLPCSLPALSFPRTADPILEVFPRKNWDPSFAAQ